MQCQWDTFKKVNGRMQKVKCINKASSTGIRPTSRANKNKTVALCIDCLNEYNKIFNKGSK